MTKEANASLVAPSVVLRYTGQNRDLMSLKEIVPIVTLSNGIRIANFSSPHSFTFTDETVLPACHPERSTMLALSGQEIEIEREENGGIRFTDIVLNWEMSDVVRDELNRLSKYQSYDIMIIPLPVMTALKASSLPIGRFRCIRMADRVSKKAHIDRFCI